MVNTHDGPAESRPPTLDDLLDLCRHLNEAEAKYIVVGGMAVIQHGFVRPTNTVTKVLRSATFPILLKTAGDAI